MEDSERERFGPETFRAIITGAEAPRFSGFFHAAKCGHDDDVSVFLKCIFVEKSEGLLVGKAEIYKRKIETRGGEVGVAIGEVVRFVELGDEAAELGGEAVAQGGVVFSEEHFTTEGQGGLFSQREKCARGAWRLRGGRGGGGGARRRSAAAKNDGEVRNFRFGFPRGQATDRVAR